LNATLAISIASLSVLSFVGCRTADEPVALSVGIPDDFSNRGGDAAPVEWWTSFKDPGLDAAIDRALRANFSLQAANQRLRAAEALARRASASFWPELNLTADGEQTDGSASGMNEASGWEVGLRSSYEVDLWGRIGALAEAEALRAESAAALRDAAAVSLSAEVALAWYRLAGAEAQKAVLEAQIETNRTVLELLDARFQRGQIRAADVLRQRQLVEATVEQSNDVDARIALFEHLLATLQGRPPQDDAERAGPLRLIELPELPRVGVPAELLERRPDLQESFLRLQAADAELAAAIADRYPRVDLTASLTTEDGGEWSLFDAWLTSLAGQLTQPLIDGGARRAEVDRREALLGEAIATYSEQVLNAYREVEDALTQEYHQRIKVQQLRSQLTLATTTYDQLRNQYLNGVSDYIDVLDALREQQLLERELVAARQELIGFRVALHRALAGRIPDAQGQANMSQAGNSDQI
jgi:NodT family efflux transporter outer membrane factor (OMF) lipoprotein